MAFEPQNRVGVMTRTQAGVADYDVGLRKYMLGVYNYMILALGLTGAVAFALVSSGAVATVAPLILPLFLVKIGLVFWLSFRVHRMSPALAQGLFWGIAALYGVTFSTLALAYTGADIARAFFSAAAGFAAMSLYGYTTQRDLGAFAKFFMIAMIGLLVALVINMFLGSTGLQLLLSVGVVLVIAGITAYDTQKIKQMYDVSDSGTVVTRKSVMGALQLYLDFITMFIYLLQIFGIMGSDE